MFKKILYTVILICFCFSNFAFAEDLAANTAIKTETQVTQARSNLSYAEPLYGMVVKINDGVIVTNLGETKNIKPGTKFYVYRIKTFIGVIQVYEVDNWTSLARIISTEKGESINRGDRLSDKELEFVGDAVYVKGTAPAGAAIKSETAAKPSQQKPKTEAPKTEDSKEPKYNKKASSVEEIFARHSKTVVFKSKGAAQKRVEGVQMNVPGVSDIDLAMPAYPTHGFLYSPYGVNLMDLMQIGGWASLYLNPNTQGVFNTAFNNGWASWPIYSSLAFTAYSRYTNIKNYERISGTARQVSITVTKWDESLAYELAAFKAHKDAVYDESAVSKMAEALIKEKGLRDKLVFEVKMRSDEGGVTQFENWPWHMYLIDSSGKRIKCEKYDPSLEKGMTRKQDTAGFVYFDKSYDTGKVKILLEDIWGKDSTMVW